LPTSAPNSGYDVIQNAITINSNASQGGVSLEPDLRGQIAPGGSIVYTHSHVTDDQSISKNPSRCCCPQQAQHGNTHISNHFLFCKHFPSLLLRVNTNNKVEIGFLAWI
jgi:hypothetical protein